MPFFVNELTVGLVLKIHNILLTFQQQILLKHFIPYQTIIHWYFRPTSTKNVANTMVSNNNNSNNNNNNNNNVIIIINISNINKHNNNERDYQRERRCTVLFDTNMVNFIILGYNLPTNS